MTPRAGRPKRRRARPERRTRRTRRDRSGARRRKPETDLTRFHALSVAGARNAADALSLLLGRPLRLDVPRARVLPIEKVKDLAGGSSRVVCALSLKVHGEARGSLLVVFAREQLPILLDMVVPAGPGARHRRGEASRLSDMERSALMEIGNILASAYLNALSRVLGVRFQPSIPGLAVDMVGAVTDHLLIELAAVSDNALVLPSRLLEPASGLRGSIFFLPHPSALAVLMRDHMEPAPAGRTGP